MLSSSPSKIHEPLVIGVSPRLTDRRRRQELRNTRGHSCFAVSVDHVPAAAQAARTAWVSCGVAWPGHGWRNLAAMMTRRSLMAMSS
jgi:hypothetical protein